jgi:hypothetical protein
VVFSHVEKIGRFMKFLKISSLPFGPPVAIREARRWLWRNERGEPY